MFPVTKIPYIDWNEATGAYSDFFQFSPNAILYTHLSFALEKFAKGYHTIVGDRGVRLSGGQLQRIALARAMIRRPDLLILDEATSALDTKSERVIQKAIEKIASETTLVVIAHRLSTIVNADYVYVLKNGCIEEKGSYDDLVMQRGLFYNMVESQKFSTV